MKCDSRKFVALAGGLVLAAGVALAGSHDGAQKPAADMKPMPQKMQQMQQKAQPGEGAAAQSGAADDARTFVELPQPQRDTFLKLMRGFMESLDDINAALAEGNFREVARIAKEDMGPAHEVMAVLRKAKVPEEKVAEVVKQARAAMEEVVKKGEGRPMIGRIVMQTLGPDVPPAFMQWKQEHIRTGGLGRFLPPAMHVMGIQLHLNAAKLADIAAQTEKPTAENYKKVMGALSEVTGQCRACHAAWKVIK